MIKEKGGVNADVFIEFFKRLMVGATHPLFLIVDRGLAHRAKKTKGHIRVASKQELEDRILAAIDDINQQPVVHTWAINSMKPLDVIRISETPH